MKHTKKWIIPVFVSLTLIFVSCNDDETEQPTPPPENVVEGTITIDATSYEDWVYFAFHEDTIVEIENFSTSMDWDIGFHRFDVRTNCGTSGPGQGGTHDAGVVDFDDVIMAPESGYSLNDTIQVIMEQGVWEYQNVPGDTALANWLTFTGPPPTYTINDNIYIVKTADEKFAKIWLKDYYNDNSEAGYVTMKYAYQPDGSRSFE